MLFKLVCTTSSSSKQLRQLLSCELLAWYRREWKLTIVIIQLPLVNTCAQYIAETVTVVAVTVIIVTVVARHS
jgi:hypothetical protein